MIIAIAIPVKCMVYLSIHAVNSFKDIYLGAVSAFISHTIVFGH